MKFLLEGNRMKKIIALLFLFLISFTHLFSQEIPARPNPPRLVNDFSGILSEQEAAELEKTLVDFANQTSTQIVVVSVKSLEGYDISDFAFQIGEKWGVGQKGKDNGVVIVVKPKTLEGKGQVFVAPGYGLESVIPDAVANRDIVDNEMIPRFKQNDYYGGLANGINVIMSLAKGEYTAEAYQKNVKSNKGGGSPFFLLILLFFVIIPIFRGRRRRFFNTGGSLPFWVAMGMMGSNHSSHSGSFGNFSSGGGGFGGFGGGSFGGGGAGGSW